MDAPSVAIVRGGSIASQSCLEKFRNSELRVTELGDANKLPQIIEQQAIGLVILTCSPAVQPNCLAVLHRIRQVSGSIPIILVAENSSEDLAIAALKAGVADYFRLPLVCDAVVSSAHRYLRRSQATFSSEQTTGSRFPFSFVDRLIGMNSAIRALREGIKKVAASDSNVLITGDTGTGKELVASAIHDCSPRHSKPLVCLNCAAIPDSLVESELFGYEKGAFTGAQATKEGKLKAADGGSIFLDEIGDMNPAGQAKILRAIETKELQRLGGKRNFPVDFRVIAATNQDLPQAVVEGRFRKDLFFRLDVYQLHLPLLRERKEDIPLLCAHFIRDLNPKFGLDVSGVTEEVLSRLYRHSWPGNVRELRNTIEAAFINHPAQTIEIVDLPQSIRNCASKPSQKPQEQEEYEKLLAALAASKWNKTKAAESLHWSRMTLYRKMRKFHIEETDLPGRVSYSPGTPTHNPRNGS